MGTKTNFNYWTLRAEAADGVSGTDAGGAAAADDLNLWDEFTDEPVVEGEFEVDAKADVSAPAAQPNVQTPAAPTPVQPTAAPEAQSPAPAQTPTPVAGEVKLEQPAPAEQAGQPNAQAAQPTVDWDKWEADSIAALTPAYEMSDEELSQFLTEPERVLPVLAARVHTSVVRNVLAQMEGLMNQLVPSIVERHKAQTETVNTFYTLNDDLKDAKFQAHIQAAAQQFRSVNPTADAKTIALKVGNMVRLMNGLPLRPEEAETQAANAAPPAAPPMRPFVPATAGATGAAPITPQNEFAQLAEQWMNE